MTVKHLEGRSRPLRLGKVVRGYQKEVVDKKTGKVVMEGGKPKTAPYATDYFIFREEVPGAADEVLQLLGTDKPRSLPIRFLGRSREQVFPQACELFRGDRLLKCRGTGGTAEDPGMVLFRREFTKDAKGNITDEVALKKAPLPYLPEPDGEAAAARYHDRWEEEYGTVELVPTQNTVHCLGVDCPRYSLTGCRPTGRLLFTIQSAERTGHWELTVHTLAIMAFNYQLDQLISMVDPYISGGLSLVPFILTMGPEQMLKIPDLDFKVRYYDPHLEVDPRWLRGVIQGQIQLPARPQISNEDIWGPRSLEHSGELAALPEPESEILDHEPGQVTVPQEGEGADKEGGDGEARQLDARKALREYQRRKKISDEQVRGLVEQNAGDYEKALIVLRELCGDP